MILNKQVSIWRGSEPPPTLYHLWFKDEAQLLRYDDVSGDWVVFLDGTYINETISNFLSQIANYKVNDKPITESPVLDGTDLLISFDGNYVTRNLTVSLAILIMDSLLTTKIYGL